MPFLPLPRFWRALLVRGGATALVLLALALTAVRLLLPQVEDYRALAEREISLYLGQPVRIARIEAQLLVLSPTLVLGDVELLDGDSRETVARVREIRVGLAPFASLFQGQPVFEQVTLVGPSLRVERRLDGSFRIQGLALREDDEGDPEAMGRWLLAQQRIGLRESHLVWQDERTGKSFTFEGGSLELRNDGERHRLSGRLRMPGDLGDELRVAIDMEGDPLVAGGLRGGFHFAAENLRPAGLLRLFPVQGLDPRGGDLAGEVWGDWEQARLVAFQGRVRGRDLVVSSGARSETLPHASARFLWQREEEGWRLDVEDLILTRAGRAWEPSRVRVDLALDDLTGDRAYTVQASFLRVEDLAAIAALVPVEGHWRESLTQWGPHGDLRDVRFEFGPQGAVRAAAAFADLGMGPGPRFPGLSGLDGHVTYAGDQAVVRLHTRDAQVDLHTLFRAPLVVKELDGEVRLRRDGPAWRVSSEGLAAANDDIRVRAALSLRLPDRGAPFLDLRGEFRDGDATTVPRYLPAHIMPENAVGWLDRAFRAGRVVEGGVLVHGRLDQFPFDNSEGRFEVSFDAEDVELDYMPGWPRLTDIDGHVVFDGRAMRIAAREARLFGGAVSATTVAIPDLLHSRLVVGGHVEGRLNQLFDYLRATELAGHFSSVLARFTAGGNYGLDLAFEQPLSGDSAPGVVRGSVTFDGSRLAVAPGVEFTDVRGRLDFHDRLYQSDGISARLFGAPATLTVDAIDNGTRVAFSGGVDSRALQRAFSLPLLARVQGRAEFDGFVLLPNEPGQESLLRLHSPMKGVEVRLPEPLGKPGFEQRALDLAVWFTGPRAGETEVAFGERFAASVAWSEEGEPLRVAVHFGAAMPPLPAEPGYLITGRLPVFYPEEWAALLPERAAPADGKTAASPPLPVRIAMDELGIESASSRGAEVAAAGAEPAFTGPVPPLDVRVDQLRYDKAHLGALALRTENRINRVLIPQLSLTAPQFHLAGSGEWRRGRRPRVQLDLDVSGEDLGEATRQLGIASVINKGRFHVQSALSWEGGPQDFALARMQGAIALKVKDGTLTEVKPGAGRLLGLLSLQALPHRLTLDFRDIFDKGMRFRTIEGTFEVKDGDAFSDNLHINALPAAVFVSGRTGLARRDFDQVITVVPDVSGTLPVAGGLALGPQVGAVLLLVQQLFQKKIDEASKFKYTVTGGWDNPIVTRTDKKR